MKPVRQERPHSSCRFLLSLFLLVSGFAGMAQQDNDPLSSIQDLKSLSLEELMEIEVTLVSRAPVKLVESPSAVQVITRNDILRSGATNIPEALRLASNLQVSQLNAHSWIIGARGFNTVFANKLLVMIDGRTVYTPLFGGVIWGNQNLVLEDIERIEVVSGPGGTLWGANAVNGVINIVTRSSTETQGTYVNALLGDFINHTAEIRHGGKISPSVSYRAYLQDFRRNGTVSLEQRLENHDTWYSSQAGFRLDWNKSEDDLVTVQGDFYLGKVNTLPDASGFDGQNVLARWSHTISEHSNFILQTYFDRYWRDDVPGFIADQMQTVDVDFQHALTLDVHNLVWGINHRSANDHVVLSNIVGLLPLRKNLDLVSGFIQDEIKIVKDLKFTLGTKILHNVYTGFEIQPSARLSLQAKKGNLVWGAVSRAVRTPSRMDADYYLPIFPLPPEYQSVAGGPNFVSETVIAYEAGYRTQANERSTFSISGFYNEYDDVYSVEALPGTKTYQIQNGSRGESWGGEFSGTYQISDNWRLRMGYTYFEKDLRNKPGRIFDPSYLGNDVRNQALMQSMLNLPLGFELDLFARYLDYLPQTLATARVPEYFTFDARLAFTWNFLTASVVGQNLWSKEHSEFHTAAIPRSVYGRLSFRF